MMFQQTTAYLHLYQHVPSGFIGFLSSDALQKSESVLHRDADAAQHLNFRVAMAVKQTWATGAKAVTHPSCCSSQAFWQKITNLCIKSVKLAHLLRPVKRHHICLVKTWAYRTSCPVMNAGGLEVAEIEGAQRKVCNGKIVERKNGRAETGHGSEVWN